MNARSCPACGAQMADAAFLRCSPACSADLALALFVKLPPEERGELLDRLASYHRSASPGSQAREPER